MDITSYLSIVYGMSSFIDKHKKTITIQHKEPEQINLSDKAFYFAESFIKAKMPDYEVIKKYNKNESQRTDRNS